MPTLPPNGPSAPNFAGLSMDKIQSSLHGARLDANNTRKLEAEKRLDYYWGDQARHLEDLLKQQFKNPERMLLQLEFSNITKEIIDQVSMVYKSHPNRVLLLNGEPAPEAQEKIYSEMLRQTNIDALMKVVNRFTNLLNTVGVQVVWRDNQLQLDVITPDTFDVIQDPMLP